MPPKKKRKKALPPTPIIITDIGVRVQPNDMPKGRKEIDRTKSDFRVHYTITLSEKCCHSGGKKIYIASNKSLWEEGEDKEEKDFAMEMKAYTLSVLERHKNNAENNDKLCRLDYESTEGALPKYEMMWRYLK